MKFIAFSTAEGAHSRASHLHNEYYRAEGIHAKFTPVEHAGKWHVPVVPGFERFYSEVELLHAVELEI